MHLKCTQKGPKKGSEMHSKCTQNAPKMNLKCTQTGPKKGPKRDPKCPQYAPKTNQKKLNKKGWNRPKIIRKLADNLDVNWVKTIVEINEKIGNNAPKMVDEIAW